jgi:uncharacterized protein (TIGR03437 family)
VYRFLLFIIVVFAVRDCRAAVTVAISPSTRVATVGAQLSFDVVVSGLGNGTALGTYDVGVVFAPALLSYSSTTFGNQLNLSGLGDLQSVTLGTGTVELFELSLDSAATLAAGQASSFRLATVTLTALAAGNNSPITLSVNAIGDAAGKAIPVSVQNGSVSIVPSTLPPPSITSGGVVPVYSSATTIESGSWISIYGTNLASATTVWNGDFPTLLGGTSVTIDSQPAYLWFVSPAQINLQAPSDTATGTVVVTVKTPGGSASSTVTLGQYGPSFSLFNTKYAAAIVGTPDSPGNSGAGYDYIGPAGALSFPARPVKSGETVLLYGVGFGPTTPSVTAGQVFSGAAPSASLPLVTIGGVTATVSFAGIVEAGLFQLNVIVPSAGSGDQLLQASIGGVTTPSNVFITLQ